MRASTSTAWRPSLRTPSRLARPGSTPSHTSYRLKPRRTAPRGRPCSAEETTMSDKTYWAARETDECVAEADERVSAYFRHVQTGDRGSLLHLWRASNRACFAGYFTGGELGRVGKSSEFRTVEVNEYGNLQQHLVTM